MKAIIKPSKAVGEVCVPPSKSMAHRLLICAGLCEEESEIRGIAPSDDILATLSCLKALGAKYVYENETVTIKGVFSDNVKEETVLNCRECGSAIRFFIPIALLTGRLIIFTGSETLLKRPLDVYEDLCAKQGFLFERGEGYIRLRGYLKAKEYEVPGNISSQFISGLLFALPLRKEKSRIKIIPPVESRPYIDMTLQALNKFGADVYWDENNSLSINGKGKYLAARLAVEGDYSNAAFLEALNFAGGNVRVTGLNENSLQGDKVYKKLFEKLEGGRPVIDISDCPDLGPVLMAVSAMKNGAVFTGTRRLKIKESDRGEAMKTELGKFGVKTEIADNSITVCAKKLRAPNSELYGHNDHRIVMSLAVLSTVTGGTIKGAEAVNKSFPDFFEKLKELNIEVEKIGMDK